MYKRSTYQSKENTVHPSVILTGKVFSTSTEAILGNIIQVPRNRPNRCNKKKDEQSHQGDIQT